MSSRYWEKKKKGKNYAGYVEEKRRRGSTRVGEMQDRGAGNGMLAERGRKNLRREGRR